MVAIYTRQSVDKKDSISIETQIELCKQQFPTGTPFTVYSDKGYSGSNINRPEFQHLLSDVKDGKIERLIVYRLDRISRSVLDFANLVDLFNKHDVSFSSTQEQFDTGTPIGRAMLSIVMVFAQLERETIQIRIQDNYYARGEKGMFLGGPPAYGFEKKETRTEQGKLKYLEPEPDTMNVLVRIFQMYGHDLMSLGEIARQLNGEQIPSPAGAQWDSSKVSRILHNPVYVSADADIYRYYHDLDCKLTNPPEDYSSGKGLYLYGNRKENERKFTNLAGQTLSLAPHDGVISSELFLSCQKRLNDNQQIDNRRRSQITWLTGLLKCAECGHSVVPKSSYNGAYMYLYCTGKTAYNCCPVKSNLGNLATVESIVRDRIFQWAEHYSYLETRVSDEANQERSKLLCEAEAINCKIQKLIDMAVESSDLTARLLDEKVSALESERRSLELEANQLSAPHRSKLTKEIRDLPNEWEHLDLAGKSRIAGLLISRVNLSRDKIEIVWAYQFDAIESYSN